MSVRREGIENSSLRCREYCLREDFVSESQLLVFLRRGLSLLILKRLRARMTLVSLSRKRKVHLIFLSRYGMRSCTSVVVFSHASESLSKRTSLNERMNPAKFLPIL